MTEAASSTAAPVRDREEWFLEHLEPERIDASGLAAHLRGAYESGDREQALSWLDLLLEALAERGQATDAIAVLTLRTRWQSERGETVSCREVAASALEKARDASGFIEHAGFAEGLPPLESLRRLALLLELKPGTLCYDKTWGFGVVRRVDGFYGRVEIDFDRKKEHHMSLSYAAETLELLSPDHILTVRHEQPALLAARVKGDAGEVVRMALQSYGPLSIVLLQEKLVPAVVAADDWKRFWETARKALKKDGRVDIPAKRTDPIRLLEKAKSHDAEWFAALAAERDLERVLGLIQELQDQPEGGALAAAHAQTLTNRLAFVIKGADPKWPALIARAVMAARVLGLNEQALDLARRAASFFDRNLFLRTGRELPARHVGPFLEFLLATDASATLEMAVELLPRLEVGLLNEVIALLCAKGRESACADTIRQLVADQAAGVEVMNWILRNPEKVGDWALGSLVELSFLALARMEDDCSGERLKAQNQLRERFGRDEWFAAALDAMSEIQRHDFACRLRDTAGFTTMDRRSLLGKAIKRFPSLERVMSGRAQAAEPARRSRFTSPRSYRARQTQLDRLVNVEIPGNSREIGVARSYGDLRENHEYKAAKEMQGILLRRQGELEKMLTEVQPSDFRDMPSDQVGPATGVQIEYADGRQETYFILGEWDRDEELHIIASTTRMAQALSGRRAGERATVPTEDGETLCTVTAVLPLTPAILAWIDGAGPA